jgi:plastocyanin
MRNILPSFLFGAAAAAAAIVAVAGNAAADAPTPPAQQSPPPNLFVIRTFGFVPATMTVISGTPISFRNEDTTSSHTVASTNGAFAPQFLGYGMVFTVTLVKAGKYAFNCSDAPYMKGEITVTGGSSSGSSPAPSSSPY